MASSCLTQAANPTSKLLDQNNIGSPATSSHHQFVADAVAKAVAQIPGPQPQSALHSALVTTEQLESPPASSTPSSRQLTLLNNKPWPEPRPSQSQSLFHKPWLEPSQAEARPKPHTLALA